MVVVVVTVVAVAVVFRGVSGVVFGSFSTVFDNYWKHGVKPFGFSCNIEHDKHHVCCDVGLVLCCIVGVTESLGGFQCKRGADRASCLWVVFL